MPTVEAITAAIAQLPPEQVAQIRRWLDERAEAEWDAQIEHDARAGRHDGLAEKALAEHRAGPTFVLVPVEDYDRLTKHDYDDSPWTREELQALAWEAGKSIGWEDMDEYDQLPEKS